MALKTRSFKTTDEIERHLDRMSKQFNLDKSKVIKTAISKLATETEYSEEGS